MGEVAAHPLLCMGLFSIFLLSGHESVSPDLNSSCFYGRVPKPRAALSRSRSGILSSKPEPFHAPSLHRGPCRPLPPSYMRLTVAISRAFDRLGVWIGAPSGPSQPAAKRRI